MSVQAREKNGSDSPSVIFLVYLVATAALCGALVMVIEVLGSRVIGPVFGASLFVWTSLITVTLVSLAAGYAVGGVLSDRWKSPDALYGLIMTAGFLVLLIPVVSGTVLRFCLPLGLRTGSLTSSTLLFGPSLLLLGCVSPYIIKIAVREMRNIGRTVGFFYAVSTLGSFVGTVLTGFVLIAYFSVGRIFSFTGFMLILIAFGYFAVMRKRWALLPLLAVPILLARPTPARVVNLPDGTKITAVWGKDTYYGKVKVVDRTKASQRYREMLIEGQVQGGIDLNNGLSIFGYSYFLQFLPYGLNSQGKDCLVIGLGAGLVPTWYERKGVRTDVVEINPAVPQVARDYFGFSISGDLFQEDARYHVTNSSRKYDYIILDVFNGDTTPGHLLSVEFFRLLKPLLREKGILAMNLYGSLRGDTLMLASVNATLGEVFPAVTINPLFSPHEGDGLGNITILAYDYPFPRPESRWAGAEMPHPDVYSILERFLWRPYVFPPDTPAIVLSDNYNPVDFLALRTAETTRKYMLDHTSLEILL